MRLVYGTWSRACSHGSLFTWKTWKTWSEYKDLTSSILVGSQSCPWYARVPYSLLSYSSSCYVCPLVMFLNYEFLSWSVLWDLKTLVLWLWVLVFRTWVLIHVLVLNYCLVLDYFLCSYYVLVLFSKTLSLRYTVLIMNPTTFVQGLIHSKRHSLTYVQGSMCVIIWS